MAKRKLVFVVDDDAAHLRAVERLLKARGFDSKTFHSAEDFFDRADTSDGICLVLDIHLSGMSGIELSRQLEISGVFLPIIFITADDRDVTRKTALEVGCVAYLHKPFPAKLLMDAIEKASAQRRDDGGSISP